MIYTWYKIFNRTEFLALDLVSKTYTLILEGIGEKDILVSHGNLFGMTYEGVFLCLELNDKNPLEFDGHAIYVNEDDDVYLGILVDED